MRALAAVRCSANTALRKIQGSLLGVGLWGDAVEVSKEEQEAYCGKLAVPTAVLRYRGTAVRYLRYWSQIPLPSVPYPPSGGARRR